MERVRDDTVYDVGVIIGRFQVSELHDGHVDLIDQVCKEHQKVVLLLGCAPVPNTISDPLDFQSREWMIREHYPHLLILPIYDLSSDEDWSKGVDDTVRKVLGANQSAVLYGSRDSFMPYYSGKYDVIELVAQGDYSGTVHRTEVGKAIKGSADWRAGQIHASQQRYPTCFATVDIAIFDETYTHMLVGRKTHDVKWRFPGGFSDPGSPDYETDAIREAMEETCLDVSPVTYIRSFTIDDWRYRKSPDCIKTMLFAGVGRGEAKAADDLAEVKWVPVSDLAPQNYFPMVGGHDRMVPYAYHYAISKQTELAQKLANREVEVAHAL